MKITSNFLVLSFSMILFSCGGGGGSGGNNGGGDNGGGSTPAPTASISASINSTQTNIDFTLTWSSTNATACYASGDWSVDIDTAGTKILSESIPGTKTYTITCTGESGSATDSAKVTIVSNASDTSFEGFAIDGYISGANIFIDQNFNFIQDEGEYFGVTSSDGSFLIETNDSEVFACLKKRPIIADVPVGAVDSTLGGVTEAYQMILPSIEDAGTNAIVISPFTSLFSEAIITGKNNSNLVTELSLEEGCQDIGNTVSENISLAISDLKNSIEINFGIAYSDLLGDFILNSTNEKITEATAQKIAAFFPNLKALSNEVSSELSSKYDTKINVDLVLSQKALNTIFIDSEYSELPLNFNTFYRTPESDDGWYTEELIYTQGAFLTIDGKVKNYRCLSENESDCINTSVTLQTVADAAETFMRTTFFRNKDTDFYTPPNGTQPGSLNINALDTRNWSIVNDEERRNCENREEINFNGIPEADGGSGPFRLDYNYQATINVFDQLECDLTNRNRNVGLNLVVKPSGTNDDNTLYGNYFITILANTELIDKRPVNLVDEYKTLDTDNIVGKIASLPIYYSQISDTRKLFTNNEGYGHSIVTPDGMRHYFTIRHQPWEDSYNKTNANNETISNLVGQAARDAMYDAYLSHPVYSEPEYAGNGAAQSDVMFNHIQSCFVYQDSKSSFPLCWKYDAESLTAAYDFAGSSSISLSDIHDLIEIGYNSQSSLDIRGALKPDDSIQGSTKFKFLLEKVDDNGDKLPNSDSMEIEFLVELDGSDEGLEIILNAGEEISFKYITATGVELTKTETNSIKDSFLIADIEPTELLDKPSSLGSKLANLVNLIESSELSSLKDYFVNEAAYKLTINLGDYFITNRGGKRVKNITSTFRLSENPAIVASIYDYSQWESTDQNLCVRLSRNATENVSVKIVDVTPQGVYGNGSPQDYTLSSNEINIASGDIEECVTLTAINDSIVFEGSEYLYFQLQEPSGVLLGRSNFKVEIFDHDSTLDPRNN
jgi:hypothetical protein